MNVAIGHDHRSEIQLYAKLFEGDGNGGESLSRLHDGEGELAAGEETGFLPVHRDEIGLGQDLEKILGLQGLDHGSEVDVWTEQEQVQYIADGLVSLKRAADSLSLAYLRGTEAAVLAGGGASDCIAGAG